MKKIFVLLLAVCITVHVITSLPSVKAHFFKSSHPEYIQIQNFEMTAIGANCYKSSRKSFYKKVLVDIEFNFDFKNKKIYKLKTDFFNPYKFIYLESCDRLKSKTLENLKSMIQQHQIELWVDPDNPDHYHFLKVQSMPDLRSSIFSLPFYMLLSMVFSPFILFVLIFFTYKE